MIKLLLLGALSVVGDENCHRSVKLWIHQDATGSFQQDFAKAPQYIPDLLNALDAEFGSDGFDFGMSAFKDREGSDCFTSLVSFGGGTVASKSAALLENMSHVDPWGGGDATEDTFTSIPYIVKHEFVKNMQSEEVRLFMIITDDGGKYQGALDDYKKWGYDTGFAPSGKQQWEGETPIPNPEDEVHCEHTYKFLEKSQFCKPLKDNVITPIIVTSLDSSLYMDLEPFYTNLFKECGYDASNNEIFFTRFQHLETAKDIIIKAVGTAKCDAPTEAPTPSTGGGDTTEGGDTTQGDHTTEGGNTTEGGVTTTGGGNKHHTPVGPIAGAAAGALLLLAGGGAMAMRNRAPHMDVEEEAGEQEEEIDADREARAEIDEGQFEG